MASSVASTPSVRKPTPLVRWLRFLFLVLLTLTPPRLASSAPQDICWITNLEDPSWEYARDLDVFPNGDILVLGETNGYGANGTDILLARVAASGVLAWVRPIVLAGNQGAVSIATLTDLTAAIAGTDQSQGFVIKIDSEGQVLWQLHLSGASSLSGVTSTREGNVAVCGKAAQNGFYWALVSSTGQLLWERRLLVSTYDQATSLIQSSDDGFLLCGSTYVPYSNRGYVIKVDSLGDLQWNGFSSGNQQGAGAVESPNGDFIIIDGYFDSSFSYSSIYLTRLTQLGAYVSSRKLVGNTASLSLRPARVAQDHDGNILIACENVGYHFYRYVNVVKVDLNANVLWSNAVTFRGGDYGGSDAGASVRPGLQSGWVVLGRGSTQQTSSDITVLSGQSAGIADSAPFALDTSSPISFVHLEGGVVDSFNRRLIPFANLRLLRNGVLAAEQVQTDHAGRFSFPALDPGVVPEGDYVLEATHEGYKLGQIPVHLSPGSAQQVEVPVESNTVVLVHGRDSDFSKAWDDGTFSFADYLEEQGLNVLRDLSLPSFDYIAPNARRLASALESRLHEAGIQSYDIVGWSMGGLIARGYIADGHGNRVRKLVTLGTPHHGTLVAIWRVTWNATEIAQCLQEQRLCTGLGLEPAASDMRPGSAFLDHLNYGSDHFLEVDDCLPHGAEMSFGNTAYYSIAGRRTWTRPLTFLAQLGGAWRCDNDGVVAISSAHYWASPSTFYLDRDLGCPALNHFQLTTSPCIAAAVAQILETGSPSQGLNTRQVPETLPPSAQDIIFAIVPAVEITVPSGQELWTDSLYVGASTALSVLCRSQLPNNAELSLVTPAGTEIGRTNAVPDSIEYIESPNIAVLYVKNPPAGWWRRRVLRRESSNAESLLVMTAYEDSVRLVGQVQRNVRPGEAFQLTASIPGSTQAWPRAQFDVHTVMPNSTEVSTRLYDDGSHGDVTPGDGTYSGEVFSAGGEGDYSFAFQGVLDSTSFVSPRLASYVSATAFSSPDLRIVSLTTELAPIFGDLIEVAAVCANDGIVEADSARIVIENATYSAAILDTTVVFSPGAGTIIRATLAAVWPDSVILTATITPTGTWWDANPSDNISSVIVRPIAPLDVSGVPDLISREPAPRPSVIMTCKPNPFSKDMTILFVEDLDARSEVSVAIYDISGRLVRNLADLAKRSANQIEWDGHDDRGRPVASGIYFVRAVFGTANAVRKVVCVR